MALIGLALLKLQITQQQQLRVELDRRGVPFGTTPTGADWCIKALHPSDPLTEVRGIPDHSAVPSLLMNYQRTFTLSPAPGAIGTWAFEASLLPHPVNFMFIDSHDSVNANLEQSVLNNQLVGADHWEKWKSFKALAQRWRLAYASVTVYQDGPDLANQGTLVVAQTPVAPLRTTACALTANSLTVLPAIEAYTAEDYPDFDTSQAMPNAYFGRSKEGAYVPLKLTETCQDWFSERDEVASANLTPVVDQDHTGYLLFTNSNQTFPHCTLDPVVYANQLAPFLYGQATSAMLSGNWAHICAKNLATTTSFSFFFRYGIEMQVSPTSTLSPQLKLSPPYDAVALNAYYSIARELKDAYPASYNDLGEMWDVISRGARAALPFIAGLGGPYGKAASVALGGITQLGDVIRTNRRAKKAARAAAQGKVPQAPPPPKAKTGGETPRGETLSPAEIERMKNAIRNKRANANKAGN